jgi:putative nucleotidyltransferase with HDIG domain/PAS domain S-box-containing protein
MVTGALGEEAAIALLNAGAKDYVLKCNLLRLPSAVKRVISVERGIRARKTAERALSAANILLRTTERIAHVGGFDLDIDSRSVVCSEEVDRILGLSADDPAPSLRRFVSRIHPADRARVYEAFVASRQQSAAFDIKFRIVRPDGTERVIQSYGEVISDESDRPTRLRGTVHDVTERERTADALRASELRLKTILGSVQAGVIMIDPETHTIIDVNAAAARLFGAPVEAIIGARCHRFVCPADVGKCPITDLGQVVDNSERVLLTFAGGAVPIIKTVSRVILNGRAYLIECLLDNTDRKRAEQGLLRMNRTLKTLSAGNEALVRAKSEAGLWQDMCRVIVEVGGYSLAWVGIVQHDAARSVSPVARAGEAGGYLESMQITWADEKRGQGPHGRAIRSGERQIAQNLETDPSMAPWLESAGKARFPATCIFPLKDPSGVFAVLTIDAGTADAFDGDQVKLLQELADDLAFGIRSMREHAAHEAMDKRWRASLEATVGAIANTVEMRDPYTAGHQQRVAKLAVAIARELRLSEHEVEGIYLAGILHDVGKIDIPAEILNKPGKLTPLQYQLIQTHAQSGYDIVKGVDFPWPIAQMVLQHHERLDGSGYPQGLKGEQIIPEARIIAVADVVEGMMSHRPYRPMLGIEAALAEIEKGKGRLFDPATVDACIALFRERRFDFE